MEESHPTRNTNQSILTATNEHAAMPPVKQKRITFWLFITLTFALFAFIALSLFGPNPPIEISVATTHLTTPLAADGYPDYAAVLKADMKKGVTPENNGAILFLRSMWPEYDEDFTVEDGELLCEELGMEGPPAIGDRVTDYFSTENRLGALRLLRAHLPRREATAKEIIDNELESSRRDAPTRLAPEREAAVTHEGTYQKLLSSPELEAAKDVNVKELLINSDPIGRPWTEKEIPFLAEWLQENQAAIDRIVEAANSPNWYLPSLGLLRKDRESLFSYSYYPGPLFRRVTRTLRTRSNFYLGNKKHDLAMEDAMAILRLANHLSGTPFILDQLVATSIAGIGIEQITCIASSPTLSSKQAGKLLRELETLLPIVQVIKAINQGERFQDLNLLLVEEKYPLGTYLFTDFDLVSNPIPRIISSRTKVDWNIMLLKQNHFVDSFIAASKMPTWQQQQTAFDKILSDIQFNNGRERYTLWNTPMKLLTPTSRGNYLGDQVNSTLKYSYPTVFVLGKRTTNRLTMAKLSVALAVYRNERGSYPVKLESLVPSVMASLPIDDFQKSPFVYQLLPKNNDGKQGYLLHSIGSNGIDDGGNCSEENQLYGGQASYQGIALNGWPPLTSEEKLSIEKIPPTADDPSLRIPLRVEPWPWESIIEEYSVPE